MCYDKGDSMNNAKCNQSSSIVSDAEYQWLIKELEFVDSTRNSLLTFSFTAVLTVIGIVIADTKQLISPLVCLLPFFLIIPFAARITYYRLVSIHINSFLKVYCKNNTVFSRHTKSVPEGFTPENFDQNAYLRIAWLINHEMFLLGLACSVAFCLKYYTCGFFVFFTWKNFFLLFGIFILNAFTFYITNSYADYGKWESHFINQWETDYHKTILESANISTDQSSVHSK